MIRIGNKVVAGSADVDLSTVLKSLNKTGLSVWIGTQTEHDALAESVKNNEKTTFITYDTDEDIYLIIDTIVSYGKTWSSVKISSELAKKINASDVYTKEQVDEIINAKLASALKYRGAVNTTALLPGSAENGDTYFVKADGFMYAYNSTTSAWDALGTVADMTNYFTKTEITAMLQDKADKFQYTVLPTPSSETVGVLLQYTGADTEDYKNGYFYKGVDKGNDTYGWELAKTGKYEDIINDSTTSASTTWSSEKISADLANKQDFRIFKSLEEFNEKKGTSLTVVSGIDNMKDIANAMSNGEMLIIIVKYELVSEVYFGLNTSTGWIKMFTFVKSNGLCDVECRTTVPLTFKRVLNSDGVVGDWQQLATVDNVASLKLTNFTPSDYSTDEELYRALVSRAFTIGGYNTVEGVIIWNNHWYGIVRVFSTSATSGTIEVINHTYQREDIVKVKEDNTVTVETVVDNTSLNSALANCTISTNGNKLVIENSSYTWELTGISK